MAKSKMTMKQYEKSSADKKEDTRNAKKSGMSVAAFKKTARAKAIDKRDLSKINKSR